MARTKTHCVAVLAGTYGEDRVRVRQLGTGRFAGRFVTIGGGYAGRIACSAQHVAMRHVESHARFIRWEQPAAHE